MISMIVTIVFRNLCLEYSIIKGGFLNQYERQKMLAEHMAQENLLHPHRLSPLLVSFSIIT